MSLVPWKSVSFPYYSEPVYSRYRLTYAMRIKVRSGKGTRGARRESRSQPDLLHQRTWSNSPKLIQRQDEGKHPLKLFAQALVVE